MRARLAFLFFFLSLPAFALSFPDLTGRVVDSAHVLQPETVQALDSMLADFEAKTTEQIVVATVPGLQGGTIEDYGVALGRHWGIGQKGKDNGVILLVAPADHKVRIEVGYGLEGTLTDAQANQIVQNVILPDFRAGQLQEGIVAGIHAILATLNNTAAGTYASTPGALHLAAGSSAPQAVNGIHIAMVVVFILYLLLRIFILPWWFPLFFPRGGFGSSGSGGFGGGFSGGGGSFGGGGASGGW